MRTVNNKKDTRFCLWFQRSGNCGPLNRLSLICWSWHFLLFVISCFCHHLIPNKHLHSHVYQGVSLYKKVKNWPITQFYHSMIRYYTDRNMSKENLCSGIFESRFIMFLIKIQSQYKKLTEFHKILSNQIQRKVSQYCHAGNINNYI